MEEKIVLYLGGGAMGGVFSGGVLSGLEKADFYPNIEAIYAASCGAINAAYFLSNQTELGASIYFDDLTHDFIRPKNIPICFSRMLWSKYVKKLPKNNSKVVVNIDHAFECLDKKPFSKERLIDQPIYFFVKLLNPKSGEIKYFDAKKFDPVTLLKGTSCAQPYFPFSETIDGEEYIDGATSEPIGLQYFLDKYPNHKIVCVMNSYEKRKFGYHARCFIEGLFGHFCEHSLFKLFLDREASFRRDLELAAKTPRVLIVHPPENSKSNGMTQNREHLVQSFNIGKEMSKLVIDFAKSKIP